MTTEQLQCFFKAAELKSFTKASEALYMSQPSLSKRISALEEELGLRLFFRDKSAVTELTAAGKIIFEGFFRLEKERASIVEEARKQMLGHSGQLRIGFYESQLMDDYLRTLLNRFGEFYPDIELVITTAAFNGLHDEVMDGSLDCAITLGYDALRRKDMSSLRLYDIPVCLVVPKPFLGRLSDTGHLSDFAKLPFITITKETNLFQDEMLMKDLGKAGLEPSFIQAKDEKNFVMLLEMGKGIAPLHIYHKCCSSPNVVCFSVPELEDCEQYLVWNPLKVSPPLKSLLQFLRQPENSR